MKVPFEFDPEEPNKPKDKDKKKRKHRRDYLDGKNTLDDEKEVERMAENHNEKASALIWAAQNIIDDQRQYSENDPATRHRKDLLEMVWNLPEAREGADVDIKRRRELETWADVILDKDSVFHVENEYDPSVNLEDEAGVEVPYESLKELYQDIRNALHNTFDMDVNLLDVIPGRIFLTKDGKIKSAVFNFLCDREDMSNKFKEKFSESANFKISYDRYLKERPYNRIKISGIKRSGENEDTITIST